MSSWAIGTDRGESHHSPRRALVAVLAAIGALHHDRTIPELDADSPTATARFSRLALLEMVGFAAVLAATGWLVVASG